MTELVKRNPRLGSPWTRYRWIDKSAPEPVLYLDLKAWSAGGRANSGRGTPGVPHRGVGSGGLSPTKYSPKQKVLLTLSYLLELWPIAAFLLFLYLISRFE